MPLPLEIRLTIIALAALALGWVVAVYLDWRRNK